MPISLHAAFVPTCRQILGSLAGLVNKAEAHCAAKAIAPEVLLGTSLIADMRPLAFQFVRAAERSGGAVVSTRAGLAGPTPFVFKPDFAAYRSLIAEADAALAATTEAEMEGWIGRDMAFGTGPQAKHFTAEDFLLSFAQPNFFFHATTAYAILRAQGIAIGKLDYLGAVRRTS